MIVYSVDGILCLSPLRTDTGGLASILFLFELQWNYVARMLYHTSYERYFFPYSLM